MFHIDLEQGPIGDGRVSFAESDVSECFTDGEDNASWFNSNTFESCDECSRSHVSSMSSKSEETVCRICKLEVGPYGQSLIELGCSCKEDMAFAHEQCAETWFKLKGDDVCEICQSVARNVARVNYNLLIEEEEGGGGNFAVAEDGECWCQRRMLVIMVLILWLLAFIMYFLQSKIKLSSAD